MAQPDHERGAASVAAIALVVGAVGILPVAGAVSEWSIARSEAAMIADLAALAAARSSACSAAQEVDEAKLKKIAGVKKLELAKPDEVKNLTGCEIGCVPPFGGLFDLKVFVDKSLATNEEIVFSAGLHTKSIKMKFVDFAKIVGEKVEDFAK